MPETKTPLEQFAAAWTTALAAMSDIVKDQRVQTGSYSYTYADLKSVLAQAREVLSQYGLAVHQTAHTVDGQPAITTIVWHRSGHRELYGPLIIPAPANAQAIGSSISYARRYALMAVLGLATEDDDGAAAIQPVKEEPPFDAKGWLAVSTKAFKDWSEEERAEAGKAAVKALKPGKPMTKTEAKQVLAHMTASYYEQHPGDEGALF